jgi:putative restriction endonuclease
VEDEPELDARFRLAVGGYLHELDRVYGDDVPWSALADEFRFDGQIVPLIGAKGIWKPACLPRLPISIATAPPRAGRPRPYDDEISTDELLLYRYRGTDPEHPDNIGLRLAMRERVPLAYFHGTARGWYAVAFPVFVVGDDMATHTFRVAVDAVQEHAPPVPIGGEGDEARRAYVTRQTKQRLHQQSFRRRVLLAYTSHCAVCRLHRERLLDAAHILADNDPRGEPVVKNGLALCKLHHAAFDANLLGIRPELTVELKLELLRERDGPMLLHGLQGFQGQRIHVPRSPSQQPDREFLAERFEHFQRAG